MEPVTSAAGNPLHLEDGPTVLVLGWGASTRRQLEPFLRMWRDLGATPTAFVPDTLRSLARPQHFRDQARALASRRWDVVHALSDNGFVAWSLILDELTRGGGARSAPGGRAAPSSPARPTSAWPAAVLLDSCPGCRRWRTEAGFASSFGRGLTPATLRALGRRPVEVHPLVTPLLERAFRGVYRAFPGTTDLLGGAYERVLARSPPVPHLVVAGPDDAIVSESEVAAFVDALRNRGRAVDLLRLTGSGHVGHLRRHPQAYAAAASALLARASVTGRPPGSGPEIR